MDVWDNMRLQIGLVLVLGLLRSHSIDSCTYRVAIIGAGISGSSLSYFMSNIKNMSNVCVDVYEKGTYNRSTNSNHQRGYVSDQDETLFLKTHQFVKNLTEQLKISVSEYDLIPEQNRQVLGREILSIGEGVYGLRNSDLIDQIFDIEDLKTSWSRYGSVGISNGKDLVFQYSSRSNIRTIIRKLQDMIKRYGKEPITKTFNAINRVRAAYERVYSKILGRSPIESADTLLEELDIGDLVNISLSEYIGDSHLFQHEVIDPIIQAKYRQNSSEISALTGISGLVTSQFVNINVLTRGRFRTKSQNHPLLYLKHGIDDMRRKLVQESTKIGSVGAHVKYFWQNRIKSISSNTDMSGDTKYRIYTDRLVVKAYNCVIITSSLDSIPHIFGVHELSSELHNYRTVFVTIVRSGRLKIRGLKHGKPPGHILFISSLNTPILSISMVRVVSNVEFVYRINSKRMLGNKDLQNLFGSRASSRTSVLETRQIKHPRFRGTNTKFEIAKNLFSPDPMRVMGSSLETRLMSSYNLASLVAGRQTKKNPEQGIDIVEIVGAIRGLMHNWPIS